MPRKSNNSMSESLITEEDGIRKGEKTNTAGIEDDENGILPIEHFVHRAKMQRNTEVEENPAFEVDSDGLSLASFSSDPDQIFDEEDLTEHDDTEEDIEIESSPITKNIPLADYFDPADPVSLYFREVNKVPLLTHEEEISLAKCIEAGRKARSTLAEGPVTGKRKGELKRIIEDGWAAREHLITANFRLVISVAKKYLGRGVPFLDLIQDGNIGLIRATKKFDYRRGHRFSTYATWWIRQAVSRSVADHGRTIRLPVHLGDQINRLWRENHKLTQELGREATMEEIAHALDLETRRVEELMKFAQRPLSLELPSSEDEENELSD